MSGSSSRGTRMSLGESTETPTGVFARHRGRPRHSVTHRDFSSLDSRFTLANVAETAAEAIEGAQTMEPGIFGLDHNLAGPLTGLAAAPLLKELAANARSILFTAYAELQAPAIAGPPVDAFLPRTDSTRLLQLAQPQTGPGSPTASLTDVARHLGKLPRLTRCVT
jgi:hypothetical protein